MTEVMEEAVEAPVADKPKAKKAGMKLELPVAILTKALAKVMPAVELRTTIPILSSVLMRPAGEDKDAGMEVVASNLDSSIQLTIPASKVPALAAYFPQFVLPAHKLSDYVKLLDGDTLHLTPDEKTVTLRSGRSSTRFATQAASHFPKTDFSEISGGVSVQQSQLARMLSFVMFAISQEESRYTLSGALLEVTAKTLRLVSTDGHRMALYTVKHDAFSTIGRTLLPNGLLAALKSALEDGDEEVAIATLDGDIAVTIPQEMPFALKHKMMSGQFPNYEAVVPKSYVATLKVDARAFAAAITRCATCADERSGCIALTFSVEGIGLRASTAETGEAEDFVDAVSDTPFETFKTGIVDRYLLDPLKRLKGEVSVHIAKADGASALTFSAEPVAGEEFKYVVMPMRI